MVKIKPFTLTFAIMVLFWMLLSARIDLLHISAGVIGSLLVAYYSSDLLIAEDKTNTSLKKIIQALKYLIYLGYSIILANLDVAYRVLHPSMPINPKIIEFDTQLKGDIGKTTLANSITLTPGTITIDVKKNRYFVHSLSDKSAQELLDGTMRTRLVEIFEDET
ncbi:MAG: Na+/H+ antiporter subunit E [Candidatus Altiarchaeales archaeon ex4484_96]|nr:MAG: Na+/H+ antiporter subunit E [Candidatus Altiarchaeales archaeon ex4484_96]